MADENDERALILLNSDDDDDGGGASAGAGGDSDRDERRRIDAGEASSPERSSQRGGEFNLGEIDGLVCSICMEAWTSDGDHHICCLPCGHIYGMSCIKKWLKQGKNQGKCPHCNRKCKLKDVRKLFASRLVTVDEKLQKRIRSLEAECASHEKKRADWRKKEAQWRNIEAELKSKFHELTERTNHLEGIMGGQPSGLSRSVEANADFQGKSAIGSEPFRSTFSRKESSCHFILQEELQVDGAHLFDVDTSEKILLVARSLLRVGAKNLLTKMSLIHPHEREDILLPPSTSLIKDLHFSPHNDGLALFTTLGRKLSLLSMECNSVVLAYDLPAAGWACSWDHGVSHHIYAGLQNGSVVMFDKRQTRGHVKLFQGLSSNPIHTLHSLSNSSNIDSGVCSVLSASSAGLCQWNFGGDDEGPTIIPETNEHGVCISLAYCPTTNDIVASYRPKVVIPNDTTISHPQQTPSQITGQVTIGSHIHYQRSRSGCFEKSSSAYGSVSQVRLPKSAIVETQDTKLFASRDEESRDLVLRDLPSFTVLQCLNLDGRPLRDVKSSNYPTRSLLGCLSGDTLQIFGT